MPSNNATFGRSDMTYQQLAMSRVRAVEHDRAVLVVTTSGVSATIAPDGTVTATTSTFTPDVLVDATPLRATTTLAGRLRAVPEWTLLAAGLAGVGLARIGTAGRRPVGSHDGAQGGPAQERTRMAEGSAGSVLVVIPTYNERDNIEPLLARLHAAVPEADALIVDDGSPDGTGELADKLAADDPRVRVLHRTAKAGLGAAYLAGFAVALQGEHQVVVEMDADGSHAPEDLPSLLAALDGPDGADVVLGLPLRARRPGAQLARLPQLDLADRQPVLPARARGAHPRHHRRVPRLPPRGAGDADAGRGRVAGLLLPDRPGVAGAAGRVPRGRGADHVHRAGARRVQDEQRDRRRGAVEGHAVGGGAALVAAPPARAPVGTGN